MPEQMPPSPKSVNAIHAIPQSGARERISVLAHRLGIDRDPGSSLNTFSLNHDGTITKEVEDALKGIKRRPGYNIYEAIITKLDTPYARAMMSAGYKFEGVLTDPHILSTVEDAHQLYQYNVQASDIMGVQAKEGTFEYVVVAQAKSEKVAQIGGATTWVDTEGSGFWSSNVKIPDESK